MDATHARSAVLAAIIAGQMKPAGLSPQALSDVMDALLAEGLSAESGLGLVCGVDLGASNCRFLVADLLGNPIRIGHEQTPVSIGATALADWLAGQVAALTAGTTPLRAVVVGLPGMVKAEGTTISGAPNVPQIQGEVFARQLTLTIPAPVHLYNDSDLALLGELRFGAGRGLADAVMFTIGAGLGSGVVLDGVLLRGRRGLTGEFGYLPIGQSGETVEDMLSGTGLLRQARALRVPVRDAAELFSTDASGGADLLEPMLERFDRALVLVLTAAAVAYDPAAIILGGGLSPAVAKRLDMARQRLAELLPDPQPDLRLASLGDLSGTLGALAVAYQTAYRALGITVSDAAGLPPADALSRLWESAL
jgi:predicted NBD/HSP70 family sugar kinase